MNISRNNYESWFLDYLDGKLNTEQIAILMSFLKINPDLEAELEGLETVHLEADNSEYDLTSTLRKPFKTPVRQNILDHFEDYCLLSTEQQLSPQEENMLQGILDEDENRNRIYRLYRSTVLSPDKNILYPGKSRLKKWFIHLPRVRIVASSIAAAAVLLLALTVLLRNKTDRITENGQVSAITEEGVSGEIPGSIPDTEENLSGKNRESTEEKETISEPVEYIQTAKTDINDDIVQPDILNESVVRESIRIARLESIGAGQLEYPSNTIMPPLAYRNSETLTNDYLHRDEPANQRTGRRNLLNRSGKKFTIWRLAEAVIQRINDFSDEDYSLERETNDYGETQRIILETPLFGLSTPKKTAGVPEE